MRSNMRASCARPVVAAGAVDPAAPSPRREGFRLFLDWPSMTYQRGIPMKQSTHIGDVPHAADLFFCPPRGPPKIMIFALGPWREAIFAIRAPLGNHRNSWFLLSVLAGKHYFKIVFFTPLGNTIKKTAYLQNRNDQKSSGFYSILERPGSPKSGHKTVFLTPKKHKVRKRLKMK